MKKLILKNLLLLSVGLFAAIFIYPFLHELGHILSALILGAEITDVSFFPVQSVVCKTEASACGRQAFIGISGGLFPVGLSLTLRPKRFSLWYANTVIKLINIYALVLDLIFAAAFYSDVPFKNNDITAVLSVNKDLLAFLISGAVALIIVLAVSVKKSAPIVTVSEFLFNS